MFAGFFLSACCDLNVYVPIKFIFLNRNDYCDGIGRQGLLGEGNGGRLAGQCALIRTDQGQASCEEGLWAIGQWGSPLIGVRGG